MSFPAASTLSAWLAIWHGPHLPRPYLVPGPSIRLKFLLMFKISSFFLQTDEFLFSTIVSVRGSLAGLKSFPESSRIWGSVRSTFFLRSFCILLHSGVNQTWYIHTIPGGKGRKYPYPTIFSVQRRKFFNLERISSFFHYKWKFHRDWGSRYRLGYVRNSRLYGGIWARLYWQPR